MVILCARVGGQVEDLSGGVIATRVTKIGHSILVESSVGYRTVFGFIYV